MTHRGQLLVGRWPNELTGVFELSAGRSRGRVFKQGVKQMTMTLTEQAATQIKRQLDKKGSGIALRIGIKKVGCTGLAHTFELADAIRPGEHSFESHGARILVDPENLEALDGSHIDFATEGLTQRFKFDNPNVDHECGCGESFNLKKAGAAAAETLNLQTKETP
jgi:iron-sulfur cluster assembly protein